MDREDLSQSLRIAYGSSSEAPLDKRKPSKNLKEALERIECEAIELGKVVGKSNGGTISDFLESLK